MLGRLCKQLVLMAALTVLLIGCDRGTSYKFSSHADVIKDKTVIGASVPEFVPKSATNIYGWFHVELNQQTVEFTYSSVDREQMVSSFKPLESQSVSEVKTDFLQRSWKAIDKTSSFEFFMRQTTSEIEYMALDTANSRSYYWTKRL